MLLKDLYPDSLDEWRSSRMRFSPRTHGSFLSPIRQTTKMPAPSRKYVPGDPVRNIDWRAFARTDQLLVREQRDNASVSVIIHVDASDTMLWPDQSVPSNIRDGIPTKIDMAWRIACHVAAGHGRMGDRIFLSIWKQTEDPEFLQVKSTRELMERFRAGAFSGHGSVGRGGARAAEQDMEHTVGYWIGDGLNRLEEAWQRLGLTREGAFLQVLSSLETGIGWITPEHSYIDQVPAKKEYLGEALLRGESYLVKMAQWQQGLLLKSQSLGKSFGVFTEQTPVEVYLRFLESIGATGRSQMGSAGRL